MKGQSRILKRMAFIKKYQRLCGGAFGENAAHADWKLPEGRNLTDKAISEIGYSSTTAKCDIFWSLWGLYKWMKDNKII